MATKKTTRRAPATAAAKKAPAKAARKARPATAKPRSTRPAARGNGAAVAAPVAQAAEAAAKPAKLKLVRDSFTIPKPEYAAIDELKLRAAKLGQPIKKSELLRAGLKALAAMQDEPLQASLAAIPRVKTGRPAKT